jgi:DNA helicase-2/ATP-dependent DNA helicase PcrA
VDMSVTQINSESSIPIEQHFRVSAGPGAGKTHWLVNHIKGVLHQSERLSKTRKIVCITYTNVAVEIILERLGTATDRVEVSTIHSFLYKHIIKPYVSFIADEYKLDVQKIDGHDDIILSSYPFLQEWKNQTGQKRIQDNSKIVKAIKDARWKFDSSGKLIIKTDYPHKVDGYPIKNDSYLKYKEMSWEMGVLHHDDVLFFSYQLIMKFPFILKVLRAKFPYFFIDEFQDTSPIQAKILSQIGQEETIVGVIGDKAQSIYKFQGADPLQFSSFRLADVAEYQISENHRSTSKIIDFLNCIRSDIQQIKPENIDEGDKPKIIVGEIGKALRKVQELSKDEIICTLSRDNVTSNIMKREANADFSNGSLLEDLYSIDSSSDRRKIIIACIKATELACQKRFKEAIKELTKVSPDNDEINRKKEALRHINYLLGKYDDIQKMSLFDFHSFIKNNIRDSIANPSRGNIKPFYENHTYQQLAVCVKNSDDKSFNRTTHKAKGDEFEIVLLVLRKSSDLSFLLNPDLEGNEEHRINYVAVSRAKRKLFISIPSLTDLSSPQKSKLFSLLDVIEISDEI